MYTGSMILGEICYKVCQLAMTDPCFADPPENLLSSKTYPYDTYHDCDITLVTLGSVLAHNSMEKRSCFHGQGGSSHPCRRGWTTWTLTEKIGKLTIILSRPFHFAILLLLFKSIFLVKQMDLVDCLQIILFHLECRYEGKLLILGLYMDRAFLPPSLEKPILFPIWVVFWSLCRVWFDVHSACQFLVLYCQF